MNFFYSINVNDRYRFPIHVKEEQVKKKEQSVEEVEQVLNESSSNNSTSSTSNRDEDDYGKGAFDEQEGREGYFEAFKREHRITNCEKGLFCDEILGFLDEFLKQMKNHECSNLNDLLTSFTHYVHNHLPHLHQLMETMNVKQLIAPYIEVNLPVKIIDEFHRLEQGDPRAHLYQLNPVWGPGIKEFGFFLDRYESTKEVLCMFVWSTIDQAVVPMPAIGLNPYPLCWVCDKGFGTLSCGKCHVAKYCSKECQLTDWIRHGGPMCDLMASVLKKVKHLCFP